jgi:hypothetical protein
MKAIQPKALILAIATAACTTLSLPLAALADTYTVEVVNSNGKYYGIVVNQTTGEDVAVTEGHDNPAKAARKAEKLAKAEKAKEK